ncbi:DUF1348 family protein, partial [Streptomyces sp. NPDC031705]|uniref:DUF1348 family protein n=1 Tax=Streptomyces sp. NPDC031705 TaxID=3155729 RepID=UPI0033DF9784
WERELDYRLRKELWAYTGNRISVRFTYEWPAGAPARQRPAGPDQSPATDRDRAKRPAESVHQWVNSSPASASSLRTPS